MANIQKRQKKNGEVSYRVLVRLKGFPLQTATFERITDAKKWAQNTESAIREGRHFKTTEAKKHLFSEAVERYIKHVLPVKTKSEKVLKGQAQQLEWWKSQIGSYSLADVTPALIAEQRDKLSNERKVRDKKISNSTVNRYLAVLSHMFTIAVNEWGWLEDSPLRKVSKLREPQGRVRFLADEEREKLLEECKKSTNPNLYPVVILALSTGARANEIIGLKWNQIDLQRKTIILHDTKNGERRVLHLSSLAYDLVCEFSKVRHLNNDLVFVPKKSGSKYAAIRHAWLEAVEAAEIEDFRFHDLRHSAASYLAMNGASLAEIAEVLGHKTLAMVKRYAHLSEGHTAGVVERMNKKIFG